MMTYGLVEPSEARPGSTGEHCCATWHGTDAAGADAECQSRLSRALSPTRGLSALTKNWPVESRCKNRAPVPSCQASSNYLSYVATQLFLLAPTPKLRGSLWVIGLGGLYTGCSYSVSISISVAGVKFTTCMPQVNVPGPLYIAL